MATIVFATFWPALQCEFVDFDDPLYVIKNPHIQSGLTRSGIFWAFSTGYAGYWQPMTWLSYMLDVTLYGSAARGFHFTNVLLHAANSALLLLLLCRLTRRFWLAVMVAGLFAVHPLRVESVVWVTERKDVLSLFFGLSALLFYERFLFYFNRGGSKAGVYYLLTIVLFALALMSKPMLVTLPFVMLLMDWWPLQRWPGSRGTAIVPAGRGIVKPLRLILEKLPLFVMSLLFSLVTFAIHSKSGAVASVAELPLSYRAANALVSYYEYLSKTFWPVNLAIFYPLQMRHESDVVIQCAAIFIVLCVLAVWASRRLPYLFVGWFWFVGTLVPVIGLVQAGEQAMADRFTYLPLIGVFILIVWGVNGLFDRLKTPIGMRLVLGGIVLSVCALRTVDQIRHWRDSESVFRHAAAVTRYNFIAHNRLAMALVQAGRFDEAVVEYQSALRIRPKESEMWVNLGAAQAALGRFDEAIESCKTAIGHNPRYLAGYLVLGNTMLEAGRMDEAIVCYRKGLEINPSQPEIQGALATAHAMRGEHGLAVEHFRVAVNLQPDNATLRDNLGTALAVQGNFQEAVDQFRESLRLDPIRVKTRMNLARALAASGSLSDSIRQFEEVLRMSPEYIPAFQGIAAVMLNQGRTNEASFYLREALRLSPGLQQAREQLDKLEGGHSK